MAKIMFINYSAHGHVNPTLALVKELTDRGNEVVYYVNEPFVRKLESVGAEVRKGIDFPIRNDAVMNFESPKELVGNYVKFLKQVADFSEKLINSNERFDCLIYDSACFFGNEIGRRLNIKTICSHTTFALNKELFQEIVKEHLKTMDKVFGFLKENTEALNVLKRLKEVLGIDLSDVRNFQLGQDKPDKNIVYTSKLLQPSADSFNESYKFVGPSITERKEKQNINFNFSENEKIVFISFGTICNNCPDFYQKCFDAFKDMDYKFIMAIGNSTDMDSLGEIPENFAVYNYVPQLEVLKKADVFITHGGMNSSSEGLYFGIPLIIIPQVTDQPIVARQIEKMGACIVLDKNNITPKLLKKSLVEITNNLKYKNNAISIREAFIECGGCKKAADEVLQLVEEQRFALEY